jgi:hypothetical protein
MKHPQEAFQSHWGDKPFAIRLQEEEEEESIKGALRPKRIL